jgi:hypothetical protein
MRSKIGVFFSLILVLSATALAQTKTVTNADIEKFKQKRLQNEAEYRAKHKELGMPSPEELERRNDVDKKRSLELADRLRYERQQKEGDWAFRANYLRNEIAGINAQINFLNQQIAAAPGGNKIFYSVDELNGAVFPSYGYGYYGRHRPINPPRTIVRPIDNVQTVTNIAASAPNPFYGTPLYPTGIKLVLGSPQNNNRGRGGYGRNYGSGGGYYPYIVNNGNPQRDELVLRLQTLGQVRAGLLAQWNNLVEEARRTGVRLD